MRLALFFKLIYSLKYFFQTTGERIASNVGAIIFTVVAFDVYIGKRVLGGFSSDFSPEYLLRGI